ncbi:hypothetical protein I7I53_11233 [Histoplasma capsulatum var. duboisii H88]|uniref:Uncharacterized protein n=1 Tax=Ajellomyces capsulatus (strain H88) TaxID=544711 RepID=A0A8A1LCX1_AJEC8|nr:hypothetical protein I7I53_11233 [Histoplasma capsulatum var. duboisii H88]
MCAICVSLGHLIPPGLIDSESYCTYYFISIALWPFSGVLWRIHIAIFPSLCMIISLSHPSPLEYIHEELQKLEFTMLNIHVDTMVRRSVYYRPRDSSSVN